jgi:hypothetical protein
MGNRTAGTVLTAFAFTAFVAGPTIHALHHDEGQAGLRQVVSARTVHHEHPHEEYDTRNVGQVITVVSSSAVESGWKGMDPTRWSIIGG